MMTSAKRSSRMPSSRPMEANEPLSPPTRPITISASELAIQTAA
jgi:hypothetical protein